MKRLKKPKNLLVIIFSILIGSIIYFYGFTYAKYAYNSIWDYYLKSKGFYLSSNSLGNPIIKNVDNLWDGGSVHFTIKNSINDTVITNYDIDYEVTCEVQGDSSEYSECHMNGTESNHQTSTLLSIQACENKTGDGIDVTSYDKAECEMAGYNWIDKIAQKDLYFDIVLTNTNYELNNVIVKVILTSTSPYHKTLEGLFTLTKNNLKEDGVTLNYENYFNYDKLIISNSYINNKCIKITWDSSKILIGEDLNKFTSYGTDLNGYVNEIILPINAKESLGYTFYSKDLNTKYNVTEFSIEEIDGC
jgi:hypothetical protein